jgi:uncharacterized membrane protein YtjA (UPF0391 family)
MPLYGKFRATAWIRRVPGGTTIACVTVRTIKQGESIPRVKEQLMIGWAFVFLIVAIVAALLGFGYLAGLAAWMAKVLFLVGLVVFVVLLVLGRRPPLV